MIILNLVYININFKIRIRIKNYRIYLERALKFKEKKNNNVKITIQKCFHNFR